MATWFVGERISVDTYSIVEAHVIDGTSEFDGIYCITMQIKHADTLKEITVGYLTQEMRDKDFTGIGQMISGKIHG